MMRVLIVDDEESVRESLRMSLEGEFRTFPATSAEDAMVQVALCQPDAMILDDQMVGLRGGGMLALVGPERRLPPVVMLCGKPDVNLTRRVMALGAVDVLGKPCDVAMLKESLRRVVGGARRLRGQDEAPLALRGARAAAEAREFEGSLDQKVRRFGRALIAEALADCRGDRGAAARRLHLSIPELTAYEADFAETT